MNSLLRRSRSGFTLVEIMIVVVIIGLLAAMAMAGFERMRMISQNTRTANDLRTFGGAFNTYAMEQGTWPADVGPGILPPEMDGYIHAEIFTQQPAIGGQYDWDNGVHGGISAAVSVTGPNAPPNQLTRLDRTFDDGDTGDGAVRIIGGNVVYALEFD